MRGAARLQSDDPDCSGVTYDSNGPAQHTRTNTAPYTAGTDAIAAGEAYFDGSADLTRPEVIELAGILAAFNEGDIGPGHCTE